MKKGIIIALVFAMILSLAGCALSPANVAARLKGLFKDDDDIETHEFEKPEKDDDDIELAGKYFFNIYESSEFGGHSCVGFLEDGEFILVDYYLGGSVEITGHYIQNGSDVTLNVEHSGLGEFEKINFRIINEDVLSLQTYLFDSFPGNIYLCCDSVSELSDAIEAQRKNAKDIIGGKTYYNTALRFGNTDTADITFNADGSFVMSEHEEGGYTSISGKWTTDGHKIKCEVVQQSGTAFTEISFYISDFEKLFLETDIVGSQKDDIFTSEMVYLPQESLYMNGVYTNASQKARGEFGASSLTLMPDGTFTLIDVAGMGATEVKGLYGIEGDVLIFSDFEPPFYDANGVEQKNFEFLMVDDFTLVLMRPLEGSREGDCFTISGELAPGYDANYNDSDFNPSHTVYLHEPIPGVLDEYLPSLTLYTDSSFCFTENVYAGMANIYGYYSVSGSKIILDVTDNKSLTGFAGQDVKQIVLEQTKQGYVLRTDLCMSRSGEQFILQ